MTLLEVCLDDIQGAIIAEQRGADRIELCSGLSDGGTTPSIGTVSTVLGSIERTGVRVLVRQRSGDFMYSTAELQAMCADIEAIRSLDAPPGVEVGFALGALTPDGEIDRAATSRMLKACGTASVTFHKAFDLTRDVTKSLDTLIDLGVDRVLTSGGTQTAANGVDTLGRLVQQSAGRIKILAAGGIRAHNVAEITARSGVVEVHFRATAPIASATLRTGLSNDYDSGSRMVTSGAVIDGMLRAIEAAGNSDE